LNVIFLPEHSPEDVLTKEIDSWKGFADGLPTEEDRKVFMKMLNNCYKYAKAINAKGRPFPTEPVIMAPLFSQHKLKRPKFKVNLFNVLKCI